MKRILTLAFLAAAGCSSTETATTEPEPVTAGDSRKMQIDSLNLKIQMKRADVARADADLQDIKVEREKLNATPASDEKTTRLTQLNESESVTKAKKQTAESDLANLERDLRQASGEAAPKSAEEALDLVFAAEERKEKEAKERERVAQEHALSDEKRKLAEAERAKMAEEIARAKEKLGSGGEGTGDLVFEERWADLILRTKVELQKYKRW